MIHFRPILSIILATLWISISEFVRNNLLIKSLWTTHYETLGLTFPAAPINGVVWGIWSLLCAIIIYFMAVQFSVWKTTLLSWLFAFVMMWLVVGNLLVLPYRTLLYAIPLSFLEIFIAVVIIKKITRNAHNK